MRLGVYAKGVELTREDRGHFDARFRSALARFGGRLGRVEAVFADENGPKGGVDKRCRVVARAGAAGTVVVEERDGDLSRLIDRAADRVGFAVARLFGRSKRRRA